MVARQPIIFETAFKSYHQQETLGEGGSGRVFRVIDADGQTYAVKCLDPDKATSEKRKRFRNEIFFCLGNRHRNIIRVLDYGNVTIKGTNSLFYVMAYYPTTLRRLMQPGIDSNTVLLYFSQMLDGVEAAHMQSIWHRDLKPENMLYDPSLETLVVADFGIAHFSEEQLYTIVQTQPHARLANFQYAAPEQRARGQPVDHRADMYALGLILNEMFTGSLPHGTGYKTIASVAPDYGYLDDLVALMIRQSPVERLASVDEVKQKLIAHRSEFASRQRLSQLRGRVVPLSEAEDPLVADPVRLVGIDYRKETLFLTLNQRVNDQWVHCFRNIGYGASILGGLPRDFRFDGNSAIIELPTDSNVERVQRFVDSFKGHLEAANKSYEAQVLERQHQLEKTERRHLEAQIQEEETRQRILSSVKT